MRTVEHVSVSEFIFDLEVLDEDFDIEEDSLMAESSPNAEFNYHMEDIYG